MAKTLPIPYYISAMHTIKQLPSIKADTKLSAFSDMDSVISYKATKHPDKLL